MATRYPLVLNGTTIQELQSGDTIIGQNFALTDAAQTFTADQTFNSTRLKLAGSSSGTATLNAPAAAGTNTYTFSLIVRISFANIGVVVMTASA